MGYTGKSPGGAGIFFRAYKGDQDGAGTAADDMKGRWNWA